MTASLALAPLSALPQPFYEDSAVTLYCADCRLILPLLPRVDLCLTDPPYGINLDYDSYNDSPDELVRLVIGVVPTLIAMSDVCSITCGVKNIHLYPPVSWILAWSYAPSTNKLACWGFGQWQPILVYGKDPYLRDGLGARPDMIHDMKPPEKDKKGSHPCPKPITFVKKWLNRCSNRPSDLILDPFAGSCTTLVAAKQLGRKAIGIEIEERYCEIGAKRLSQEELFP